MEGDNQIGWKYPLLLLAVAIIGLAGFLHESFLSMVRVWDSSSDTYAHGYIILPISIWLIWRKRNLLMSVVPQPDYRAFSAVILLAFVWLFGRIAGAQVVEHYTFVGLAISFVWALLGWNFVWSFFFPLVFLLMMVPAGEFMVEPLIYFTADFTVFMVQAIGIPVYREGTFFSLPTGQWSVVTGCSGIRYFLSSVVLGWLFAYLTYRTWWKRVVFGVAAVIIPILANGFRATIIVLIAHFSDMQLALGVDHFIYGWVWFGIVMLLMFWVGNIWREEDDVIALSPSAMPTQGASKRIFLVFALVLVAMVATAWAYEHKLVSRSPAESPLNSFSVGNGWSITDQPVTTWNPEWSGTDDERLITLQKGADRLLFFMGWYGTQEQDSELVNEKNTLVREKHPEWRKTTQKVWQTNISGYPLEVNRALLDAPAMNQRMVVLQWNRLSGQDTISLIKTKLKLAWNKLLGKSDAGAVVIIAAPYHEHPQEADAVLVRFLEDLKPAINRTLDQTGS